MMRRGIFAGLLFVLWSIAVPARAPLDLGACYDLALERSTSVAISQQDIDRARARYVAALGGLLPQYSLTATERLQDTSGVDSSQNGFQSLRFSQPSVAVTLTAPLFQGLREFAAVRLSRNDKALQSYNLENARRLLFLDVASAFYSAVKADQDVARTSQMIGVVRERINEIGQRVRLGKSRQSELAGQETELAILAAELEMRRGQRDVAYEMLGFLTGLTPHPRVVDRGWPASAPASLAGYLALIDKRPDVTAAKSEVAIAEDRRIVARSQLLPNADVQANYYPYRQGYLENVNWDVSLNLKIPLFDLQSVGEYKESKSILKQTGFRAEAVRRQSETEIRQAYVAWQSLLKRASTADAAARSAAESYRLLRDDYALGLVTSLDVLTAQKTWLETMRLRDETRVLERLQRVQLHAAAGVLP